MPEHNHQESGLCSFELDLPKSQGSGRKERKGLEMRSCLEEGLPSP